MCGRHAALRLREEKNAFFRSSGTSASSVALSLQEEGLHAIRQGLAKGFKCYELTGHHPNCLRQRITMDIESGWR